MIKLGQIGVETLLTPHRMSANPTSTPNSTDEAHVVQNFSALFPSGVNATANTAAVPPITNGEDPVFNDILAEAAKNRNALAIEQLSGIVQENREDTTQLLRAVAAISANNADNKNLLDKLLDTISNLASEVIALKGAVVEKSLPIPEPISAPVAPAAAPPAPLFINAGVPDSVLRDRNPVTLESTPLRIRSGPVITKIVKVNTIPKFIRIGRSQRPVEVTSHDCKSITSMKLPKPKKGDNASLSEYLLQADFVRYIMFSADNSWSRAAIRQMTVDLPEYFHSFVNAYLVNVEVNWDDFITKFYEQFFDVNEITAQTDELNAAKQLKNQRVQDFANFVKTKAARANMTDTKQLGRIFYKGLLPELHQMAKETVPAEGFTLPEAIEYGVSAERSYEQLQCVLGNDPASKKRKNTDTRVTSVQPEQKHNNGGRNKKSGGSNKPPSQQKQTKGGSAPEGTPTGILYLVKDANGKPRLHPAMRQYRLDHKPPLCLRCGRPNHESINCKVVITNTDQKKVKYVTDDYVIPIPFDVVAAVHVSNDCLTKIKIRQRLTREMVEENCLVDTGAFLNYIDPTGVRKYDLVLEVVRVAHLILGLGWA